MNDLQAQGRACYKRGDYKQALAHFDRAIGRAASVQLLDNRSACLEKLGDLPNALKDAKTAIQTHREDPTGYLRAGRILVKMAKEPVALEIYSHGLRSVKHVGQGYEILRNTHKELLDKLSPPRSLDPMSVFPREIAEIILKQLSFKQNMAACLVSKPWCLFIRSCPDLWRHLDLSQARRKVRSAFISRAINIGRDKLTTATLHNLWDFDKALRALVLHTPLTTLSLLENGLLGDNLTKLLTPAKRLTSLSLASKMAFPADEIQHLLHPLAAHLESLECHLNEILPLAKMTDTLESLQTLKMTFDSCQHLQHFFRSEVHERLPNLRSLTVHGRESGRSVHTGRIALDACTNLTYLDISLPTISLRDLRLPATLQSLRLAATGIASTSWPAPLPPPTFPMSELEELNLEIGHMGLRGALRFLDHTTDGIRHLRKLAVRGAEFHSMHFDGLLAHPHLANLQHLHLPGLIDCRDEDAVKIINAMPRLLSLDLSETKITGISVRHAIKQQNLQHLAVNNCSEIGIDAIAWAREQGVEVQHRMSNGEKGRKVRY